MVTFPVWGNLKNEITKLTYINEGHSCACQLVSPSSALKEGYFGAAWAKDGDTSWYQTEHMYKTTTAEMNTPHCSDFIFFQPCA